MENKKNTTTLNYRGKNFYLPELQNEGFEIVADAKKNNAEIPSKENNPIMQDLNSIWSLEKFKIPNRKPISLGFLKEDEKEKFSKKGLPKVLDMPIKFPGSNFRIPKDFEQFKETIERIAHFEAAINPDCFDEYYCYLTVDQSVVFSETLQREAPCHVDGFQGARWSGERINHTYVVTDNLPTAYYIQPFDLSHLDITKHNVFWEMNKIVAETKSAYAWKPEVNEINMIDAYTVHRGTEAKKETFRTWIRLSFEVRKFDRLGNAKNPLFKYDWEMVPRDIEGLNLVAFDETCDPSLRVFPWQDENGVAHIEKKKTKPKLD